MTRTADEFLQVQRVVAERGPPPLRRSPVLRRAPVRFGPAAAAAAAAALAFSRTGYPMRSASARACEISMWSEPGRRGPQLLASLTAAILSPSIRSLPARGRQTRARLRAQPRERGPLREESVSRMDRLEPVLPRRRPRSAP